jgi:hypothetical protein
VSDCCLTPNDQYEELGISKNTNFDKEDIFANHKSFMSSLNIPNVFIQNAHASTLTSPWPDPKGHVRYYHHIASIVVCKSLTLTLEGCRKHAEFQIGKHHQINQKP